MVLTDKNLQVSTAQSVGVGTSVVSTNSVDMLTAGNEWGTGYPLSAHFIVTTTITGPTGAEFEIIAASDAALTTNIASLGSSGFCPITNLVASAGAGQLAARIEVEANPQLIADLGQPSGDASATGYQSLQRYLGVRVKSAGNGVVFTAGAFSATFVTCYADSTLKSYRSGFTVL